MNLCPECGKNMDMVGIRHRCIPITDGGSKPTKALQPSVPVRVRSPVPGIGVQASALGTELRLGPSVLKLGRPRIGEVRGKPWEAAGMSRATWYRRQREARAER